MGFDLQLFAEDESEGGSYTYKDPVTGIWHDLPEGANELIGHIISSTRSTVQRELKGKLEPANKKLEELAQMNQTLTEELEALREQTMSADDKKKSEAKKEADKYTKQLDDMTKQSAQWQRKFFDMKLQSDIYSAFDDVGLYNPEQTAVVFIAEGKARIEERKDKNGNPTGDYITLVTLTLPKNENGETEEVTGTPKELFRKWVSQDRNLHHMTNGLRPGGGSRASNSGGTKSAEQNYQEAMEQAKKTGNFNDVARALALKYQIKV
jgi:chaperonin cofactor prefoldin